MESQSYSQRDWKKTPVDSSETQSQSDAKSLFSQRTGLSQGRAYSTSDPFSPSKLFRQLAPLDNDTASTSASSVYQSQSQRSISHTTSRHQQGFLAHRTSPDPMARLEEFRQRYQSSLQQHLSTTTNRAPRPTFAPTHDFSFRRRRDWRHNDLEDFDDLLTIKSYSTDSNFTAFNPITQTSLQPQASQQQQQQQQSSIHDEDMDDIEFRIPARSASDFSVFDDDDDDDDGPAHSWRPPPTDLYEQSLLKRRRLSPNIDPDITTTQKNNTMIPPSLNIEEHERRYMSQQSKEELQQEQQSIPPPSPSTAPRDVKGKGKASQQQSTQPPTDVEGKRKATTSQQQATQPPANDVEVKVTASQQQPTQPPTDVEEKGKASQQSSAPTPSDVKGKGKATASQPSVSSLQQRKEPTSVPNMDFEIDFDDMDFGGDDYNQQPEESPARRTSDVEQVASSSRDHEHIASGSRDHEPSQDNTSISEQRHLNPETLIQVRRDGRFGDQMLAIADEEERIAVEEGRKRKHRVSQVRPIGKMMFRQAAIRMSKDVENRLSVISDAFYQQATNDLLAYAQHAKRRTISKEDVITLLRRQGKITKDTPVEQLAHKYLPRELWDEFCVSALAYNELHPKGNNNTL